MIGDSEEIIGFLTSKDELQDEIFDKTINAKVVNQALKNIDEKYREVIILRYFEHKEYEEISDILKIPVGSVGTLLHRGKKQVLRELNLDAVRM